MTQKPNPRSILPGGLPEAWSALAIVFLLLLSYMHVAVDNWLITGLWERGSTSPFKDQIPTNIHM